MTAAADCRPPDRVVYQMARAICRERCAFMGEPACWQVDADDGGPYPWPPESCDSPGCMDLAQAAAAAIATSTPPTSHARPPMSEITDEVVERALAAYRKSIVSPDHPTGADIMRSIIHAVSPMIAAQERERCAALVDTFKAEVQANIDDNIARVRVVQSEPGDNRPLIRARDWLAHAAAAIRQEPGHE